MLNCGQGRNRRQDQTADSTCMKAKGKRRITDKFRPPNCCKNGRVANGAKIVLHIQNKIPISIQRVSRQGYDTTLNVAQNKCPFMKNKPVRSDPQNFSNPPCQRCRWHWQLEKSCASKTWMPEAINDEHFTAHKHANVMRLPCSSTPGKCYGASPPWPWRQARRGQQ